ncbi:uncharacterized protein G2W53_033724 [Senna tora]|uniref:Uncharacterized protein n=1 Tax=Senna tora TaxID=362788 RepID=A0A834W8N6_9FABA|nr:uncharacterized protein G2W53_033724 [Senna tora]
MSLCFTGARVIWINPAFANPLIIKLLLGFELGISIICEDTNIEVKITYHVLIGHEEVKKKRCVSRNLGQIFKSGSFSGEFSPEKMVEEDGKTEREGEEYGAVAVVVAGTVATAAGLGGGGIWGRRREKERGSVWGGLIWGRRRDFRRESRRKVWWRWISYSLGNGKGWGLGGGYGGLKVGEEENG